MPSLRLEAVNALAELERAGFDYEPSGENEVRCRCPSPAHNDKSPSVSLNVAKMVWRCHTASCGQKGDFVTFLALALEVERATIVADLSTRYDIVEEKSINPQVVEKYHAKIGEAGPLLVALRQRGITDEMIRKRRLGYWSGRITIPVYGRNREILNVRRYLPGAPGNQKMQNTRGYGTPPRIFMPEQLKHDKIWICGGECKAMVAAEMLNPHGVGAICATASEGTWRREWTDLVKGKEIWICFDVDEPGRAATTKVARQLVHAAKQVRDVKLPLDKEKHPKGDINDWVGAEGATSDDFVKLMEASAVIEVKTAEQQQFGEARAIAMKDAVNPAHVGTRIAFQATVSGFFETPFFVPKRVGITCDRNQKNCGLCPIFAMDVDERGFVTKTLPKTSPAIVDIAGAPSKAKQFALAKAFNVPPCKAVDSWTARSTRCTTSGSARRSRCLRKSAARAFVFQRSSSTRTYRPTLRTR